MALSKWFFSCYQNKEELRSTVREPFRRAQNKDVFTSFWRPSLELDKSLLSRPFGRLHRRYWESKCFGLQNIIGYLRNTSNMAQRCIITGHVRKFWFNKQWRKKLQSEVTNHAAWIPYKPTKTISKTRSMQQIRKRLFEDHNAMNLVSYNDVVHKCMAAKPLVSIQVFCTLGQNNISFIKTAQLSNCTGRWSVTLT
jgi:hypothetical protein